MPRGPLVEKNGSKIRRRTDSDIPTPVSETLISTWPSRSRVATWIAPPQQGVAGVE